MLSLSFGTIGGYPSAVSKEFQKLYTEDQISWMITSTMIGALIGSGAWSQLTPRVGPKKSALVCGVAMLISWCVLLNFDTYWCIIAGRMLNGVSMGGLTACVPHYVNDITEDSLRGTLGSIMVLAFNIGTLVVYLMGGFLSAFHLTIACAVVPAVFIVIFLPCPESPVYLMQDGRADHGRHNLKRLRYPRDVTHELASSNSRKVEQKARWADLVTNRAARKTLLISMGMFAIGQFAGTIPVLSYIGQIFEKAGGSVDPVTGSCIVATVQIIGSLVGIVLIDRAGRRILMISSCLGMAIGHGLLGYALMPGSTAPGWLPVTTLSGFMLAFSIGAGSVPYVLLSELSTPSMRPMIVSVNMIFNGVVMFAITKTYSDLSKIIGVHGVFWTYAVGCFLGSFFTFFFLPETARRSNACIQEGLEQKRSIKTMA